MIAKIYLYIEIVKCNLFSKTTIFIIIQASCKFNDIIVVDFFFNLLDLEKIFILATHINKREVFVLQRKCTYFYEYNDDNPSTFFFFLKT